MHDDKMKKEASDKENLTSTTFQYTVNNLPGKVKKNNSFSSIFSPRNRPKAKMYGLFIIGTITLMLISYIAVDGVEFHGQKTYLYNLQNYIKNETALASFIIMVVVNLFWILINTLIEYLAFARGWIPPKKKRENEFAKHHTYSQYYSQVFVSSSSFNEELYLDNLRKRRVENVKEDEAEFEIILQSAMLSPLAFLWVGVKKVYRFFESIPKLTYLYWNKFNIWSERKVSEIIQVLKSFKELLLFFLNPFNLIDEIIDSLVTILVKFLYPAILTPIIFFIPVKYSIYFNQAWQILLYFALIGGLRLGIEFFSIYIRFLRNTRL